MDSMGLWLVIGAAVAIAGMCVILLQKKAGEARTYLDELQTLRNQLEEHNQKAAELQREAHSQRDLQAEVDGLSATLHSATEQTTNGHTELTESRDKLRQSAEDPSGQTAKWAEMGKRLEEQSRFSADSEKLGEEIAALKKELEEKTKELATVEKRFEEQMDEVVQSSIQKITHAEQAKEEAIQAAQDNFEAAAEANARLKEKDELIRQLQG
mgnify:FL=1